MHVASLVLLARSFVVAVMVASAIYYFAANNLVGLNYLIPGRYSFPIVCVIFLVLLLLSSCVCLSRTSKASLWTASTGASAALIIPYFIFFNESEAVEDYFLFGFPFSVTVSVLFVSWVIGVFGLHDFDLRKAMHRSLLIYSFTVVIYFSAVRLGCDGEYLRFIRQQIYILPVMGVLSAISTFLLIPRSPSSAE